MMSTSMFCLFIAMILPYLARVPVAIGMKRQKGGYDNEMPRVQQQKLEGFAQRALGAHHNSFEALILFATALFIASQGTVDTKMLDMLAMVFIGVRVGYIITYVAGFAVARSVFWFIGIICIFWIALL